jgi:uncharacterized protein (TIGR02453 family)
MTQNICYQKASLDFIETASRQKNPLWLDQHRSEYEKLLVSPTQALIQNVKAKMLQKTSPTLQKKLAEYRFPSRNIARLKKGAGPSSLNDKNKKAAIYRDWVGIMVTRDSGSMYDSLPGFYFHLSPEDTFTAGGLYMPSAQQTKFIRKWIDHDPSGLIKLLKDPAFKKIYSELGTERQLKTKPRDYSEDHPYLHWLKLSAWYVWKPLPKKVLYSKQLADVVTEHWLQVFKLNLLLDDYISKWPKESTLVPDSAIQSRSKNINWDL